MIAATLVATVVAITMGGCAVSGLLVPDPVTTSVTEESLPPSATLPPPVEPVRPQAMDDDGREGAIAAAQYYRAVQDYAYFTANAAPMVELTATDCGPCQSSIAAVRELRSLNQHAIVGEPVPDGEPGVVEHGPGSWMVGFWEDTGGLQHFDENGDVIDDYPAGSHRGVWVVVARHGSTWLVHDIGYV